VHSFSEYDYLFSLYVSGDYVPIIMRNNCIYATLGICHSVWMTVRYAGWNYSTLHTIQSSTQSDKYQVSHKVISPDDGHIVARNMYRKEINILRKIVHQVGFICKTATAIAGSGLMPTMAIR